MIKYIRVKNSHKANWLDDQGVLVGFNVYPQCRENFGYRVYDKKSRKPVFDDPDGLPYHFAKTYEVNGEREYRNDPSADLFQVEMFPDNGKGPILVFECFNHHNWYYYHDFEMKVDFNKEGAGKNDDRSR